jgi:hypothetical protein
MRLSKSLLCSISALALATGAAFAGEDSTHRWHGTGAEYHEATGGLELFSDADAVGSEQFSEPVNDREILGYDERDWMSESDSLALSEQLSEPMNDRDALAYLGELDESASVPESESLALSEPDLIYEETIVMVPSADTEMSLG